MEVNEKFNFVLADTLNEDGIIMDDRYDQTWDGKPTIADSFDYVMYGSVSDDLNKIK